MHYAGPDLYLDGLSNFAGIKVIGTMLDHAVLNFTSIGALLHDISNVLFQCFTIVFGHVDIPPKNKCSSV